jgi:hypothetical protein
MKTYITDLITRSLIMSETAKKRILNKWIPIEYFVYDRDSPNKILLWGYDYHRSHSDMQIYPLAFVIGGGGDDGIHYITDIQSGVSAHECVPSMYMEIAPPTSVG